MPISRPGRRTVVAAAVAAALLLDPAAATAFKPITHLWVAQQVLNDVVPDGRVTINGRQYRVDPELVRALELNPDAYRMGHIGPDAFPDVMVGQVTTHPGLPEPYWQTDDWLASLVRAAGSNRRNRAFAYGYLGHAAGDIFAHSYVNWYAGGVFNLFEGDPDVETRHYALESYIARHTPPRLDHRGDSVRIDRLDAPVEFLRDHLIFSDDVALQYQKLSTPPVHLTRMHAVNARMERIAREVATAQDRLWRRRGELEKEARQAELRLERAGRALAAAGPAPSRAGGPAGRAARAVSHPRITSLAGTPASRGVQRPAEARAHAQQAYRRAQAVTDSLAGLLEEVSAAEAYLGETSRETAFWSVNVKRAGDEYIRMSRSVTLKLLKRENPRAEVTGWLGCWGYVVLELPDAVGRVSCTVQGGLRTLQRWASSAARALGQIVDPNGEIAALLEPVRQALIDVGVEAAKLVLPVQLDRMIDLLRYGTEDRVVENLFGAPKPNSTLLTIPDFTARVNREMHLDGGAYFDPLRFAPAANAVTLAKLTLLGPGELNRLLRDNGGQGPTVYGPTLYPATPDAPFNVLFGAVRSIDGSDQWQEYSRAYLRAPGLNAVAPCNAQDTTRRFGYGAERKGRPAGMRLWMDETARRTVFSRIFIGPLNPAIDTPEVFGLDTIIPPEYPFVLPSAADPFPLTRCR